MDTKKLDRWSELLLDTGKRNNLVNFKDTKASTVEVISPEPTVLFDKVESSAIFEVYDPKTVDLDEMWDVADGEAENETSWRSFFISEHSSKVKKNSQIFIYNDSNNPIAALKNIDKKAKSAIEETGVNVAYMALGFIHWKEEGSSQTFRAPILLSPVLFENRSAIDPYYVKMTEDDVIVNPTFNYKLQSEYGIKLPEYADESLDEYISKVKALVERFDWSVTGECKIGLFSFLKINMYRDLKDNAQTILKNDNVKMLIGDVAAKVEDNSFDGVKNELIDLHNVVDADSSQLEAIRMAKSGKSFVLQGPPGTGKSQTITNIIAECLSDGKKVLFVSEKLAALNVVYEKLKQAGLSEFCLELHSHKASKKNVISDLCHTLRTSGSTVSQRANSEIIAKIKSQEQLDEYVYELHAKRPLINKSLYSLYEAHASFRNAPDIKFSIEGIDNKGEEYFDALYPLLEQYVDYIPSIGRDYRSNVWFGYCKSDSSYQTKLTLSSRLTAAKKAIDSLAEISSNIDERFDIKPESIDEISNYGELFAFLATSGIATPALLDADMCALARERVSAMLPIALELTEIGRKIDAEYDDGVYKLDASDAYKRLTRQFTGTFSRLFNSEYKKIIIDLRLCRKSGSKPKYYEAVKIFDELCRYQEKYAAFEELEKDVKEALGRSYVGIKSDWTRISNELKMLEGLIERSGELGRLRELTADELYELKSELSAYAKNIKSVEGKEALEQIVRVFDPKLLDLASVEFETAAEKCVDCADNMDMLDNWCRFYCLLCELDDVGALPYINYTIDSGIEENSIISAYCKAFYRQHIDRIIYSVPVFANFSRIAQDKAVEVFCDKDEVQFEISKARIKAQLSSKRPSLDMISAGSAVSILLREGEKKRKQKGIRTLLCEAGELIQVIKPCFLMSPLSVSTFLSASDTSFDVVIFDEASQIFPQDAIGAIYRAKQLIVVGDSKQMPPSNFFNATAEVDTNDEESGDVTDFESILDICSTVLPQLRLKWHYRSRYEQLISFSNEHFYDGDLVTFPSSSIDKDWIGVDYHFVDGVFDRATKANIKEAEYIVDLIYKNIEKYPQRSLGVVAFSISQQDLIERLLFRRRRKTPELEQFFRSDREEPFFIKNLETVQGDERDTIIFSVGYAKDAQGKLLHNFGPLNRVGGERRLNVAITRAKMNVQLVTSMHSHDIDLGRAKSEGAKLLCEYLDYAENGVAALTRSEADNLFEQTAFDFETQVAEFLRSKGFEADTRVGCSGFRIDIAVRSPESKDYVMAIECDGESYRSAKNVRDRDRLRQTVLERMGWSFYRLWSTDWIKNKSVEQSRLLAAIQYAIDHPNEKKDDGVAEHQESESFLVADRVKHFEFPKYKRTEVSDAQRKYPRNFQAIVKEIMKTEAPLSEEWLLKRAVHLFDREKVTSAVVNEFEIRMSGCEKRGIVRKDKFLYLEDQGKIELRVPDFDDTPREIKYIALEELAAGMYEIIKQNVTLERSGLFMMISNQLGFSRYGSVAAQRFEQALELLEDKVDVDGKMISIK